MAKRKPEFSEYSGRLIVDGGERISTPKFNAGVDRARIRLDLMDRLYVLDLRKNSEFISAVEAVNHAFLHVRAAALEEAAAKADAFATEIIAAAEGLSTVDGNVKKSVIDIWNRVAEWLRDLAKEETSHG